MFQILVFQEKCSLHKSEPLGCYFNTMCCCSALPAARDGAIESKVQYIGVEGREEGGGEAPPSSILVSFPQPP